MPPAKSHIHESLYLSFIGLGRSRWWRGLFLYNSVNSLQVINNLIVYLNLFLNGVLAVDDTTNHIYNLHDERSGE
jgi:hypothetical protein